MTNIKKQLDIIVQLKREQEKMRAKVIFLKKREFNAFTEILKQ